MFDLQEAVYCLHYVIYDLSATVGPDDGGESSQVEEHIFHEDVSPFVAVC